MKARIVKATSLKEFMTPEGCAIAENWGSKDDEKVSIARARVKPGVTTKEHHLKRVQEIYLIAQGRGIVNVGDLEPTKVSEGDLVVIPAGISQRITNAGKTDLVFYCVCTPKFSSSCYHSNVK